MILTTEILVLPTVNLVYEGIARAQVDSGASGFGSREMVRGGFQWC